MEKNIATPIIEFFEYCSRNKVLFAHGKAATQQIRLHWQICYAVKLSARDAIEIQGVMYQINKQLFGTRYTNTSDVFEGFIHFCVAHNYKFQRDSDESEKFFQKLWTCYFCENIEIGKVIFWMRKLPNNRGLDIEISTVKDEEMLDAAHFCAENNIYINASIYVEKTLKSFWLTNFNKNIHITNKYFLEESMFIRDGYVNLFALRKQVKAIAKDLNKKVEGILKYCENNLLVITDDEKGMLLIKAIWWKNFQQALSDETALVYLKRTFLMYKYWILGLKQNFDFVTYSNTRDLTYEPGKHGIKYLKEVWQDYYGRSTNESYAKQLLRTIKIMDPNLIADSIYRSNNNIKKIHYDKLIQYCEKESIYIPIGKAGYVKIQEVWEKIYSDKISINQAKERFRNIRKIAPLLVNTQVPQKRRVLFYELEIISKIERQELVMIFSEYCRKNQYSFAETEDDMNKIEQIWNKCFEIK